MARVADEEIERLKTEVDLAELITRSGVSLLRRQGRELVGRCPFHEDSTPSVMVNPKKGLWHCMGSCHVGGSAIDWVMRTQAVSFRHAVELLRAGAPPKIVAGRRAAVATRSQSRKLPSPLDVSTDDRALLSGVIDFYHQTLLGSKEALEYLSRRKIDDAEMVTRFALGYANRTLGYRLPQSGWKAGAEVRGRLASLGVLRPSGHELFRGSLTVPIVTPDGEVAEVYGRKIRDDLRPGTPSHLYLPGPHRGVWNEEALACGEVILTESLIDALTFYSAGFTNVTASFGTGGFTNDHDKAFARHKVLRVLLAYDHDKAGDQAATKLAETLMARGVECFRVQFPAGCDANEVAMGSAAPRDALGSLIRHAHWMGKGAPPTRRRANPFVRAQEPTEPSEPDDTEPDVQDDDERDDQHDGDGEVSTELDDAAPDDTERDAGSDPFLLSAASLPLATEPPSASPVPRALSADPVEADDDELKMTLGRRWWRVRGLSRATARDALKVNVAVCDDTGALHVDMVDLYSSRSRLSFVREAAAELGAEEEAIKREIGRVLLHTEGELARRADELAKTEGHVDMSDEEREAALALLSSPDLAERIVADFTRLGVVGEEANALICYLAVVSRKCEKPIGVLVQSSSAAGKSTLAEAAMSFCPEEDLVAYSAMTGQSLYYLGEADLAHKVLFVAEEEGASRASYALKLLQSEGKLSIASAGKDPQSGKLVTHTYAVRGPVALITTTTAADIDEELANRLVTLAVSEDSSQTRAIHAAQRRALTLDGFVARHQRDGLLRLHRNAQRLLGALPVVVPDAEALCFDGHGVRSRRDHAKYLSLICASALLHQHQRERRTVEVCGQALSYVEAASADIALADTLAKEVLMRDTGELAPATAKVLDALVEWSPGRAFTRREAREHLGFGDTQLKVHLARLVNLELVAVIRTPTGFSYDLALAPTTPERSERTEPRSGGGRSSVAGRSGGGRSTEDLPSGQADEEFWPQAVGFGQHRDSGTPDLVVVTAAGER